MFRIGILYKNVENNITHFMCYYVAYYKQYLI